MPSLEAASGAGPSQTNILIADVVRRVKCEIADAFDDKLGDRNFDWLWNWTAKVDLQLQVNETAGASPASPTPTTTPNAFIYSAGSELTNGSLIGYFQQTFTLAGGVTYNAQAQRAETVSFTLPLQEVKAWRAGLDGRAQAGAMRRTFAGRPAVSCVETSDLRNGSIPHSIRCRLRNCARASIPRPPSVPGPPQFGRAPIPKSENKPARTRRSGRKGRRLRLLPTSGPRTLPTRKPWSIRRRSDRRGERADRHADDRLARSAGPDGRGQAHPVQQHVDPFNSRRVRPGRRRACAGGATGTRGHRAPGG